MLMLPTAREREREREREGGRGSVITTKCHRSSFPHESPNGMGNVEIPLLFQSKLLCFSLLYLITTLPLSLYVSFSHPRYCLFAYTPPQPSSPELFSYPKAYGEHKYALPTASSSSCTSPLLFSEYRVALKEIQDLCANASSKFPVLRYLEARGGDSFAGNFSSQKRKSFFNHDDDRTEVPCGFLQEFPVRQSDKLAMESCEGVVVASAVFGDHDKIRQPKGLGAETLETVCFFVFVDDATLKDLRAHKVLAPESAAIFDKIGAWRVVAVPSRDLPYKDPAMNGVILKHLVHRLFPNSKFSIWVDAKLQLMADPLLLIHSLLVSKDADMAVSKHPFNVHIVEEAVATARWRKWGDVESLRVQMETYCQNGLQPWTNNKLPYTTDVPDTALIVRRHGLSFSCLLFNELEGFNPRDQLAFAYVRDLMSPRIKINMFEVEVFEQVAVEYRHNIKRDGVLLAASSSSSSSQSKRASMRGIAGSGCEAYLIRMWESYRSFFITKYISYIKQIYV